MKFNAIILIILFFSHCNNYNSNKNLNINTNNKPKLYYLKKEINNYKGSKFFADYDIFSRKGIQEILDDTLKTPFFQIYSISDTTYNLKIFYKDETEEYIIPTGNQTIYSFFDICDGPKHVFSKIVGNEIIRYGYDINPYDTLEIIMPNEIEIVTRDTCYYFFIRKNICLDTIGIGGRILPFAGRLKRECDRCLIEYYTDNPKDSNLHHYYRYVGPKEELGKDNPGNGLRGYKRKFRYWRDFHNLKAMI